MVRMASIYRVTVDVDDEGEEWNQAIKGMAHVQGESRSVVRQLWEHVGAVFLWPEFESIPLEILGFSNNLFNFLLENWQVTFDDCPHDIGIDVEIFMNQRIAHSNDI